jgi:DNA-binding NarL/FixJ family response regulator
MGPLRIVDCDVPGDDVLVVPARLSRPSTETAIAVLGQDAELRRRAVRALAAHGLEVVDGVLEGVALIVLCLSGAEAVSLSAVRELRERVGDLPLVAIGASAHGRRILRSALRARVEGLVYEDQIETALPSAVQAVLADQVVVPREGRRLLAPALSQRERQVLALVVLGHGNSRIADRLFLSESTVKSHLTSVFAKLGVSSRAEATSLILDPAEPVGRAVLAAIQPDMDVFGERTPWT